VDELAPDRGEGRLERGQLEIRAADAGVGEPARCAPRRAASSSLIWRAESGCNQRAVSATSAASQALGCSTGPQVSMDAVA
jgi:hypothetical protein